MKYYQRMGFHNISHVLAQIAKLRFVNGEDISDDLYALSCEPDLRVRLFSACLVHGVRYHTVDRERNRRTQNSGVMVEGTHDGDNIDFYGCLKEIIQLQYNSDLSNSRSVVLFRCDCFDTHGKKVRMKDDGYFRSINNSSLWYKDDPFILATQSTKVFYLKDTKHGESWQVVQKFAHRHLWNVAEKDNDEIPDGMGLSYQDDQCEDSHLQVNEEILEDEPAANEDSLIVDASVVDEVCRQREEEVEANESSDDEHGYQYCSDNEGPTIPDDDEGISLTY